MKSKPQVPDRKAELDPAIQAGARAGLSELARAPSLLQDRFRQELSSLETWEQMMMLANLQRIASMMDAEALDAAPHLVADARAFEQDPGTQPTSSVEPDSGLPGGPSRLN